MYAICEDFLKSIVDLTPSPYFTPENRISSMIILKPGRIINILA